MTRCMTQSGGDSPGANSAVRNTPLDTQATQHKPMTIKHPSDKVASEPNPYWEIAMKELDRILKKYPHTNEDLEPPTEPTRSIVTFVSRAPTPPQALPKESQPAPPDDKS